jgi:predicted O-linked N-acetylglucosamine transferase (SPINDLY family)
VKPSPLERARELRRQGKLEQAAALCEGVLARHPRDADALFLAGSLDLEANRAARAAERLKLAVELRPDKAPYLTNLGIAYGVSGSLAEAENALRGALSVAPTFVPALHQLGIVLADLGRFDEAFGVLSQAISAEPKSFALRYTLVRALVRARRATEARTQFDAAIGFAPRAAEQCSRFAAELEQAGELRHAEALARRSTELAPALAAGFVALGRIQARLADDAAAVGSFERAAELEPELLPSFVEELGTSWLKLGCLERAVACRERALALAPDLPETASALLFLAPFRAGVSSDEILTSALRYNERYARPRHARRAPHPHDRAPERRLRVGYVSPNFRDHVQRLFVLPVFRHHDRSAVELVCYSSVKRPDSWTARLRATADAWHDVSRFDDAELSDKIRSDRIDVLVDLTLHMPGSRLLAFAERPAPVQIQWLAYPGTTGVDGIDYRITDPLLDPPEAPLPYSERSLRVSQSFWCYDPGSEDPPVTAPPAIEAGFVTFGCLNNFAKVNHDTLTRWARVCVEVPDARLVLLAPAGRAREFATGILGAHGVGAERIEFLERLGRDDYLATYRRIDIALDCLPYNGHTTTLDAFWMGVPVVTEIGTTIVGRAGMSMARHLGLDELVARDADEFVRIAVDLARAPRRLAALRRELRERLRRSPLMDAAGFTRELERAYRTAWREFCANAP